MLTFALLSVVIAVGAWRGVCFLASTTCENVEAEWDDEEEVTVPTSTQGGGELRPRPGEDGQRGGGGGASHEAQTGRPHGHSEREGEGAHSNTANRRHMVVAASSEEEDQLLLPQMGDFDLHQDFRYVSSSISHSSHLGDANRLCWAMVKPRRHVGCLCEHFDVWQDICSDT